MTAFISPHSRLTFQPPMHVYIVGIGGSGMSAIAQLLLGRGFEVSGSDMQVNELTQQLQQAGARIFVGHAAEQVNGAEVVVCSSAVPAQNPELVAATRQNIPVMKRAEFLGALMEGCIGFAVAGSHGKTTITGIIAHIFIATGRDPSVVAGGVLPALGSNGRAGKSDYFIIEADEYDYTFWGLRPTVAIITNIDHDHPDLFPTEESYRDAFVQFARLVPAHGQLILCADDKGCRQLLSELSPDLSNVTTYGILRRERRGNGDRLPLTFSASDIRANQLGGSDFLVHQQGTVLGIVRLAVPGEHNVLNALAAIAAAQFAGISFAEMVPALADFTGMNRRFQLIGESAGITIIDDYAHHPTEIRATLSAAQQRYLGRTIWAVWQPHTYSRTQLLQKEFANSFNDADRVILLDIYRSREKESHQISTAHILAQMQHTNAYYIPEREAAAAYLLDHAQPGDVILTLSAGDGNQVGEWVLDGLRNKE